MWYGCSNLSLCVHRPTVRLNTRRLDWIDPYFKVLKSQGGAFKDCQKLYDMKVRTPC